MDTLALTRSIYRSLLRQSHSLPCSISQSHFVSLSRSLISSTSTSTPSTSPTITRLLRHLLATNSGHLHALQRSLDLAYGLRGKLSHHPSSSPRSELDPRNAPLPPRANPNSEESRLLGPLIPQRVSAIQKRWVRVQEKKLSGTRLGGDDKTRRVMLNVLLDKSLVNDGARPQLPRRLQPRPTLKSISPPPATPPKPKGELTSYRPPVSRAPIKWGPPHHLTDRFLRRRFQAVLGKVREGTNASWKKDGKWRAEEEWWDQFSPSEIGTGKEGKSRSKKSQRVS